MTRDSAYTINVANTTIVTATNLRRILMDGVIGFRKFVKKLFFDHNTSKLHLNINTTQRDILMGIDTHRGKSMSQISREVGLEKSSFTRSVDHLVKEEFIKKEYSASDRRIINILFTEKGNKAVKLIKDDWNKYFNSLIAVFSPEERKDFFQAVETVSKYMNRIVK